MKTIKPLSTISYNSKAYLELKLDELIKAKKVQFWCYIRHQAEEDEKKDHYHVFIEPCNKVETSELPLWFTELKQGEEKPLKTLVWQTSNFADWLWYGIHDKGYLLSKNQTRKHHYDFSDIVTNDQDELDQRIIDTPRPNSDIEKIEEYFERGLDDMEIMRLLHVPLFRLQYSAKAIQMLRSEKAYRNEKANHEADENGELKDEELPF